MTIPTKPDFAKAYQSANEILVTSSVITKFPFSTKETVLSQSEPTVVARKRKTNTILKPDWMQC